MILKKRITHALILTVTLMQVSGCASGSRADFCMFYQPVYMAQADTEGTKRQIDGNNAVWVALCDEAKR